MRVACRRNRLGTMQVRLHLSKTVLSAIAFVAWAALITFGTASLIIDSSKTGLSGTAPWHFPESETGIHQGPNPVLLVFLHPHCPCSRSILEQIQTILDSHPGKVDCRIYVVVPPQAMEGWENGTLVNQLKAFEKATVEIDRNGIIASQFSANTSGQVLLYRSDGVLAFSGGITAPQSHVGQCPGLLALVARLQNDELPHLQSPVFGCPLFNSFADCKEGKPCKKE